VQLIYLIVVVTTTIHQCRSGAHKSYAPDHESKPTESYDSDSNWAALEEKQKKAKHTADPTWPFRLSAKEKQKGPVVADNCDDNTEGYEVEGTSEDDIEDNSVVYNQLNIFIYTYRR